MSREDLHGDGSLEHGHSRWLRLLVPHRELEDMRKTYCWFEREGNAFWEGGMIHKKVEMVGSHEQ